MQSPDGNKFYTTRVAVVQFNELEVSGLRTDVHTWWASVGYIRLCHVVSAVRLGPRPRTRTYLCMPAQLRRRCPLKVLTPD